MRRFLRDFNSLRKTSSNMMNSNYNLENVNLTQSCRNSNINSINNPSENVKKLYTKYPKFSIADDCAINVAAECIRNGGIIALPTDTIYGLACDANDLMAVRKLYSVKGRILQKPVAVCVADLSSLRYWGDAEHLSDDLLNCLLPGPVTIVINKSKNLNNPHLNPGVMKIGIRIPKYRFIQDLCSNINVPLALTSANKSNEKSSLEINEFRELWPYLDAIFDGGPLGRTEKQRLGSTVVDLSCPGMFKVLRYGISSEKTMETMKQYNLILDS